ncbi:hypothetical protein C4568_02075 [Candidatus Parcubacteria bacterium]|nr:MAG: hypothetical protein C4568_02075 [Candidatus Parcubacteria bacterium]
MEAKNDLRREAIRLRKQGLSYNEIKSKINVSKSSLSFWLKDIPLSDADRTRLYSKQIAILARGPNSQKERRKRQVEKIMDAAKHEISKPLSRESILFLGAALYWAEGSKTRGFEITNSDPYSYYSWLIGLKKYSASSAKHSKRT